MPRSRPRRPPPSSHALAPVHDPPPAFEPAALTPDTELFAGQMELELRDLRRQHARVPHTDRDLIEDLQLAVSDVAAGLAGRPPYLENAARLSLHRNAAKLAALALFAQETARLNSAMTADYAPADPPAGDGETLLRKVEDDSESV